MINLIQISLGVVCLFLQNYHHNSNGLEQKTEAETVAMAATVAALMTLTEAAAVQ